MSNYLQGELLSAGYDVWINNQKLDLYKKECITSIEVEETTEGADTATMNVSDPNFEYIEDNIFVEDTPIKIQIGWNGYTYRSEFSGWIATIDIDFNSDGVPVLNITCMDDTHRMNREKHSNTWNNMTSAQVVEDIVRGYGFQFVCESGYAFTQQETITQSNQTDIDFIQSLAGEETALFTARLVDNREFHYEIKGKLTEPKMVLTYVKYPHDIISFSPKINVETRQESVTSGTVNDDKSAESTTYTVENSSGNTSGSLKQAGNGSSGGGSVKYDATTGAYTKV